MPKQVVQFAVLLFSGAISLWVGVRLAGAQSPVEVMVFPPAIEQFPAITTFLTVHDAQGNFVSGLQPEDIRVFEDDLPIANVGLTELSPGVQFVLAVSAGSSFDIRDARGVARYDYILDALRAWARESPTFDQDDLSFVADDTAEALHLPTRQAWLAAVEAYSPPGREATPTLSPLGRAVEIAAETPPRQGMERVVLWLTSPQSSESAVGLQAIGGRARQGGVQIFVWLLASPDFFTAPATLQLQQLAADTGGQFFAFSNTEPIPSLETYLAARRSIYRLAYESQIVTGGTHQLVVEVSLDGVSTRSAPQAFGLTVQPPNPIFVSLPTLITRYGVLQAGDAQPTFTPEQQQVEVLIEFPDGFTRPISQTVLYVDRLAVAANVTAPFTEFTWDLRPYTESGVHLLRVEVVDRLGMSGFSIETPVQVIVQRPRTGWLAVLSQRSLQVAGLVVLVSGAILGLVLILGGRIRPSVLGQAKSPQRTRWAAKTARSERKNDPLTQPVDIPPQPPIRRLSGLRRFQRLQQPEARPKGYLMPIVEPDEADPCVPIPLGSNDITFGCDSDQATHVLEDPSVSPRHAYLRCEGDVYRLADCGSAAGTWVNYTPVSSEGVTLEHGDLVHIGRVGFRFTLRQPGAARKVHVVEITRP